MPLWIPNPLPLIKTMSSKTLWIWLAYKTIFKKLKDHFVTDAEIYVVLDSSQKTHGVCAALLILVSS